MHISFKDLYLVTESYKEKISNYKITDPYIKHFIMRYENLLDWARIKSHKKEGLNIVREINHQIQVHIERFYSKKITHGEIFSKVDDINWDRELQMLRTEAENGNAEAAQALQIFESNPKESKEKVLEDINSNKKQIFSEWQRYLDRNDIYSRNPAFIYTIMKGVLDRDGSKRNPPTPLNASIVARMFDKIKQTPEIVFKIEKIYKTMYSEYLEAKNEIVEGVGGSWMKISAQYEDKENFEENVKDLMSMSHDAWCIRQQSFAESYLKKGPFWLYYIEDKSANKHAQIALRFVGDRIQEIRGATRDQHVPEDYKHVIVEFIKKMNFVGGEGFVKEYYRKQHDGKVKQYFKDNGKRLLTYYESNMSNTYCPNRSYTDEVDEDGEDIERTDRLLNWYRSEERTDPKQMTFDGMDEPNDFKVRSLLYGLLENSLISYSIGHDYVHVSPYITEIADIVDKIGKDKDDTLNVYISMMAGDYEHDMNFHVIYHKQDYIDWIETNFPNIHAKAERIADHWDESIEQVYSDYIDDFNDFIYAEEEGIARAREDEVYGIVDEQLPNCLPPFTIEKTDGYDVRVVIGWEDAIDYLVEHYEEIVDAGSMAPWSEWESMSKAYGDGFCLNSALQRLSEEFVEKLLEDQLDEIIQGIEDEEKTAEDDGSDDDGKKLYESVQSSYLKELNRE